MNVGDTIWMYDGNCRVYARDDNGHAKGGPIYRHHWRAHKIIGETTRSWLVERSDRKIPKNPDPISRRFLCFSEQELDERVWINDNRHKLCDLVRECSDYRVLRDIAELMEYEPK